MLRQMLLFNLKQSHHQPKREGLGLLSCLKVSPGQHGTQQGGTQRVQPFFSSLTTWSVSRPFPFRTYPSQPAALSNHLLWMSAREQMILLMPYSGPSLLSLKPDPLKWIPGHQNTFFFFWKKMKKVASKKKKMAKTNNIPLPNPTQKLPKNQISSCALLTGPATKLHLTLQSNNRKYCQDTAQEKEGGQEALPTKQCCYTCYLT